MIARRSLLAALATALVVAGAAGAQACKLPKALAGWPEIEKPTLRLAWKRLSGPIRVGKPFAIEVAACLTSGAAIRQLRVDATMPAHGHGMNYKPTEKKLGPGWSRFDGFVFHMPGKWQISFDLYGPAGRVRVNTTVDITQ